MVALTGEEWAMLGLFVLFVFGILYARSNKKRRTQKLRNKVANKVYQSAINAQNVTQEGVTNRNKVLKGANVNSRSTPMDLQDPSRMYVRSVLSEITHRDYLLENEFLNIDG